jgi:predicted RNA binding protein YcfA (HicA-like mRNA interferase family)
MEADVSVEREAVVSWLLTHGFVERRARATSHRQFVREGVTITVVGHGPKDLSRKHLGMLLRQLERAGFERAQVRRELGG